MQPSRNIGLTLALICCVAGPAAAADETDIVLKPGPDAELTRTMCSICHSVDYIESNSPFLEEAGWDKEVHKMIKVMGAPISEEQAALIVAYLTRFYGVD